MTEVDPAPLHSFTARLHPTTTFDLACQISSHLLQTPCREYPAFTVGLQDMDPDEAHSFLSSLLNHNLRVLTTDGRIFWGSFKCTDPDRNIVLAQTYEYRSPSKGSEVEAVNSTEPQSGITDDMTARYLGLVVVPGHHIVKLEVDRFASQMKPQLSQIV